MKLMEDLKWRGLVSNMTDENIEDVLEKEKLTFYVGTDPTARSLHIGHLIFIVFAKRLMDAGHKPIILVGGATCAIGDPSGKSEERKAISMDTVFHNVERVKKQISRIIDFDLVITKFGFRNINFFFNISINQNE